MTWAFHGDFFSKKLEARDWRDRTRSQANPETVNASGVQILVATLYAHPLMVTSLKGSIRKQIDYGERFVRENPEWVIARSSPEARAAIADGKRVLIFALEGAAGFLDTEEDLVEFVDQKGIRIVAPLHLTDDHFGGAALLRGLSVLASPIAWARTLFSPVRDHEGVRLNDHGLSNEGRELILRLRKRGVWVDLAHSSDRAQEAITPLLAGAPLLYTHTVLRKYHRSERSISTAQLEAVRDSGGIVGLMPSTQMLEGTPTECGPFEAFVTQYREMAEIVGAERVVTGSDFNGALPHLPPGCGGRGMWNISELGNLWEDLRAAGAPVPARLDSAVERFLTAWERVERGAR